MQKISYSKRGIEASVDDYFAEIYGTKQSYSIDELDVIGERAMLDIGEAIQCEVVNFWVSLFKDYLGLTKDEIGEAMARSIGVDPKINIEDCESAQDICEAICATSELEKYHEAIFEALKLEEDSYV